jgi:hypothetical protein
VPFVRRRCCAYEEHPRPRLPVRCRIARPDNSIRQRWTDSVQCPNLRFRDFVQRRNVMGSK